MPELAEVESWRELSESCARGKVIAKIYAPSDPIVFSTASARRFAAALQGRRVTAARRRGKHLWWEMDARPWPAFHFGMTGSFRVYDHAAQRAKYTKVEFLFDDGMRLGMINKRRLGRIRLFDDPESSPPISELGRDPFLEPFTRSVMSNLIRSRKAPVKALLLNQSLFAGVGNWLADEVLYQAKLDPRRKGNELHDAELGRLARKLNLVVRKAVELGAYSGNFPRSWLFHRRWDWKERIAAGERLKTATIGGRTTVWDPERQK